MIANLLSSTVSDVKTMPGYDEKTPVSEVYLMDCVQGMKHYPDNYFDLAVVDPPYGININHNIGRRKGDKSSGHEKVEWDNEPPSLEYFCELFRVSKNQVVWGANHFISRMPYDSKCWLMWDKKFSEDVSFAQFELAWTSLESTCKKYDKSPTTGEKKIHPTQKPVSLYDWIYLRCKAEAGMKVLDTHLGSGSNRISAHKNKLDFIAFEVSEQHYNNSEERFKIHVSQPSLF